MLPVSIDPGSGDEENYSVGISEIPNRLFSNDGSGPTDEVLKRGVLKT
jgi:hypothetical protein